MSSVKPTRSSGKRTPSQIDAKTILSAEVDRESADSRRVAMLKCQMIQLERQLLLLTDIIGQRKDIFIQTSDSLGKLIDMCRKGISQPGHTPNVAMRRSDLTSIVENARDLQSSLVSQHDNTLNDRCLQTAITPYNKYLTGTSVCSEPIKAQQSGSTKSLATSVKAFSGLNLSQVSLLEQSLADLRGKLIGISNFINTAFTKSWMPPDFQVHYSSLLQETTLRLEECSTELLELSLLVPIYPATVRNKALPLPSEQPDKVSNADFRRIVSEVKSESHRWCIETKTRQLEQESALLKAEMCSLRREIDFHNKIYDKQNAYFDSLMNGMRKGYSLLQTSVRVAFVDSLSPMLSAYGRMEKHPSETALREFLDQCRTWMPVVKDAVDNLEGQLTSESEREEQIFQEFSRILVSKVKEVTVNKSSSVSDDC